MQFSALVSAALALAAAQAVIVTETDYAYYTVTVDANAPASTSTPPAVAASTTASEAASSSSAADSVVVETVYPSTVPAAAPTTSSSSTSVLAAAGSTTETPAPAPTISTSSTSLPPPPPPPTTTAVTTTSSDPAPTTSSAAPSSTLGSYASDIVAYHNKVRAEHEVGPVTWSDELANYAQNYLNGDNCVFKHSGGPYGENIAIGYGTSDAAMDAWYIEYKDYDYSAGQFSESTGHFTQMVWKGTNQVGCATVDCSGSPFLVCEYYPRGNIIGYFTQNVFP